jgi:hypothetical protein
MESGGIEPLELVVNLYKKWKESIHADVSENGGIEPHELESTVMIRKLRRKEYKESMSEFFSM